MKSDGRLRVLTLRRWQQLNAAFLLWRHGRTRTSTTSTTTYSKVALHLLQDVEATKRQCQRCKLVAQQQERQERDPLVLAVVAVVEERVAVPDAQRVEERVIAKADDVVQQVDVDGDGELQLRGIHGAQGPQRDKRQRGEQHAGQGNRRDEPEHCHEDLGKGDDLWGGKIRLSKQTQ